MALAHTATAVDLMTMALARIVTKTGMEQEDVKDLAAGGAVVAVEAIGAIEVIDIPVVCHSEYLAFALHLADINFQ